jgi:hypothetical protein
MSTVDIVFLSAAICGFAIFAIVLACVDYRTGKATQAARRPGETPQIWKKAA